MGARAILHFGWTFLLFVVVAAQLVELSYALPPGFITEVVSHEPATSGVFAPNPRNNNDAPMLLLAAKDEGVRVLEHPDDEPSSMMDNSSLVVLDMKRTQFMCTNGERGLQAIAVHPKFHIEEGNYWIYLFYTEYKEGCLLGVNHPENDDAVGVGGVGPRNIVARFQMDPKTLMIDQESKQELWASPPGYGRNHNGGAMAFGVDGKLWITMGDNNNPDAAQDLTNTLGTVIRINAENGNIPVDNPFSRHNGYQSYRCSNFTGRIPHGAPEGSVCGEIFAYGFRNPFRITMDPTVTGKVKFTIQDVGQDTWEEISVGGTDYAGRNYGWPMVEGVCKEGSTTNCDLSKDSDLVEPYHWYMHRDVTSSSFYQGGCITAGVFVPEGIWPAKYRYLFADFTFKEVYNLMKRSKSECRECNPPLPGTKNVTFYQSPTTNNYYKDMNGGRMTDLFFGPFGDTQTLYLVQGGDDTVLRIRYTGSKNAPPLVNFSVPKEGSLKVGESIQFARVTTDEDGDDLAFKWYFGDGSESDEENPEHVYNQAGQFRVTLTVTDAANQTQQISHTVVVGQKPDATMLSPTFGEHFQVGQLLTLLGEAVDSEGGKIPDSQIEWEVRQHHADHYHPFMSRRKSTNFQLDPAPGPEDFWAATNSFLEVIMYATDDNGITAEIHRDVMPQTVIIDAESVPRGMTINVDGFNVTTPRTFTSWTNYHLPLEVYDQPPALIFSHWENMSGDKDTKMRRTFLVPPIPNANLLLKAVFCIDSTSVHNCTRLKEAECCRGKCIDDRCTVK